MATTSVCVTVFHFFRNPWGAFVPGPAFASADEEWFPSSGARRVGQSVTKLKAWRAQSNDILCES